MELRFQKPDEKKADPLLESLQQIEGVEVERGLNERDTYKLTSQTEESTTTAFLVLHDQENGADITFVGIRTLPKEMSTVKEVRSRGEGSALVQKVIRWGHSRGLTKIIAMPVQSPEARSFWRKNGFIYNESPESVFEEWVYQG